MNRTVAVNVPVVGLGVKPVEDAEPEAVVVVPAEEPPKETVPRRCAATRVDMLVEDMRLGLASVLM